MLMIGIFAFAQAQEKPFSLVLTNPQGVVKSTITANDTVSANFSGQSFKNVVAVQVGVTRLTGKIGASSKIFLMGNLTGSNYEKIDSLVLRNQLTNSKVLVSTNAKYYNYYVFAKIDSIHTGSIEAYVLTR